MAATISDLADGLRELLYKEVNNTYAISQAGGAAGVQYTEGDTDSTVTGTAVLWEDTSDTLRAVSAAKPLPVNIVAGAGSGGTAITDDAAFTAGSTSVTPVGGVFDDTTPDSVDEGDAGALRMSANRNLYTTLRDAAGNERGAHVTTSNALKVDGSAVTQPISGALSAGSAIIGKVGIDQTTPGTTNSVAPISGQAGVAAGAGAVGATVQRMTLASDDPAVSSLQVIDDVVLAEDAAHGSGDKGVMSLAVRKDSGTAIAGTDGDYSPLQVDSSGNLRVNIATGVTVTNSGTFAVQESGAALTALQVIDDWDESDRAKVNPIAGQAGVAAGSGVAGVTTQRVVLATDVALPTGTNSIGQVTANAGTNLNTSALATSAQIGEVQASPTSNTVLDRLKALLTGIVLSAGSAIIGKVGIDQTTPGSTNGVQNKQYSGVPSTFTIGTTDATVFTLAAGEIGFIQNLDDAALAVKKGASASTTSLSLVLNAGTAADDGKGGAIVIDDWIGAVSVAATSGSPRYIAWKQAAT